MKNRVACPVIQVVAKSCADEDPYDPISTVQFSALLWSLGGPSIHIRNKHHRLYDAPAGIVEEMGALQC